MPAVSSCPTPDEDKSTFACDFCCHHFDADAMNHLLQLTKIDANAQKKMDKLREDAVARVAMVQITLLLFISLNVQYCRSKVLVKREFSSLRIQKTKQNKQRVSSISCVFTKSLCFFKIVVFAGP